MNLLQTWLILGVPLGATSLYLFIGRSKARAWLGYAGLAATVAIFLFVPEEGGTGSLISAAAFGSVAFVFVATGRGTHVDDEFTEHHVQRRRYTTAREDA